MLLSASPAADESVVQEEESKKECLGGGTHDGVTKPHTGQSLD